MIPLDDDDEMTQDLCPICGKNLYIAECGGCGGSGYSHHDCGEDACCCLDKSDNVPCDSCDGSGYVEFCAYYDEHKPEAKS